MSEHKNQLTVEQKKLLTLRDFLKPRAAKLSEVLVKGLSPERIINVAIAACSRQPRLLECNIESIYLCIQTAAQLGLEPGGALAHAYLVPFKSTCQLIVGYKGLCELAYRSERVLSIEARVVNENDYFDLSYGLENVLKHAPTIKGAPGELIGAYAVVRLKGGGVMVDFMTRADIERIRSKSRAKDEMPWTEHFAEMAKKTVLRRLLKTAPQSISAENADVMEKVERAESGEVEIEILSAEPNQSATDALAEKLAPAPETPAITAQPPQPQIPKTVRKKAEPVVSAEPTIETVLNVPWLDSTRCVGAIKMAKDAGLTVAKVQQMVKDANEADDPYAALTKFLTQPNGDPFNPPKQ